MDITQQLITYYKGERFEAVLLIIFGVLTLGVAIYMWQYLHHNQLLKGLFYPIAFLALFTLFAGGYNAYNNNQRLEQLPLKYKANQKEFVETELDRFEGKSATSV